MFPNYSLSPAPKGMGIHMAFIESLQVAMHSLSMPPLHIPVHIFFYLLYIPI